MPTVEELGQLVKGKYPNAYDDMSDADLGRRIKEKFPGAYDDFAEMGSPEAQPGMGQPRGSELPQPAPPQPSGYAQWLPGGEFIQAAGLLPTPQRQQMPAEELAPPLMPQAISAAQTPGVIPAAGEVAGGAIGSLLYPGVGTVLGASAGAGIGQGVEDYLLHGAIDPKRMALESALSFVPEAGEQAFRGISRWAMKNTPGGKQIRWEFAADKAREMPELVFDPPSKQEVDMLFDQVRQSGVKIDVGDVRNHVQALTSGKYDDLLSEIRMIDNRTRSGGRFQALVENMRGQGLPVAGYDIGDLQRLRSELMKRKQGLKSFEAQQLLDDMQRQVDDAVDTGLARGRVAAGQTPQILQQARRSYARMRSAEDLSTLVEKNIADSPDLTSASLRLNSLVKELRVGKSKLAQQINRSMDLTPGARERYIRELDSIAKQYKTIELPLTDVAGFRRNAFIAGAGQMISTMLLSDTGRRLFRDSLITGRGKVSPNVVAAIVSAVRREYIGPGQIPLAPLLEDQ